MIKDIVAFFAQKTTSYSSLVFNPNKIKANLLNLIFIQIEYKKYSQKPIAY